MKVIGSWEALEKCSQNWLFDLSLTIDFIFEMKDWDTEAPIAIYFALICSSKKIVKTHEKENGRPFESNDNFLTIFKVCQGFAIFLDLI